MMRRRIHSVYQQGRAQPSPPQLRWIGPAVARDRAEIQLALGPNDPGGGRSQHIDPGHLARLWCRADGYARGERLGSGSPEAEILTKAYLVQTHTPPSTVQRLWTSRWGWFLGRTLAFEIEKLRGCPSDAEVAALCTPQWKGVGASLLSGLFPADGQILALGTKVLDLLERACGADRCDLDAVAPRLERLEKILRLAAQCGTMGERQSALLRSRTQIASILGAIRLD